MSLFFFFFFFFFFTLNIFINVIIFISTRFSSIFLFLLLSQISPSYYNLIFVRLASLFHFLSSFSLFAPSTNYILLPFTPPPPPQPLYFLSISFNYFVSLGFLSPIIIIILYLVRLTKSSQISLYFFTVFSHSSTN